MSPLLIPKHIARQERASERSAEFPERECRATAEIVRRLDPARDGEIGARAGRFEAADLQHVARLRCRCASFIGTGSPFFSINAHAPTTAMLVAELKRSVGPVIVISRPAAPSGFPTSRFAKRSERESNGPHGGTPTSQYPTRPGQSCTVVIVPAETTSMVCG